MASTSLAAIPAKALVRFIALLDDTTNDDDNVSSSSNSVTMNCAQAASLSKLVADQAAATEWGQQEEQQETSSSSEEKKPASDEEEVSIPVPIGTTDNLRAIVKYLSSRLASPQREIPAPLVVPVEEVVDDCDKEFLKSLGGSLRKDVIALASIAHYLNIPTLRDLMCACMATMMSQMTVDQMQAMLGVENDFSDSEINILKKELGLIDDFQWKENAANNKK